MQELQQRILQDGDILPGGVVRVERFLNHRVDTALARHIGQAFADAFRNDQIDCILTVEASGIIFAMTTALAMGDLPVIIAKKGQRRNLGDDVYTAEVFSFTHQTTSTIHVGKRCLEKGQRVLLIDDFLANGEALKGLMDICRQAECHPVGAGICIEKCFQPGGETLRGMGLKVVSLAAVEKTENGEIRFLGQE